MSLPPGSTTIVSGGPMRSSTMLFCRRSIGTAEAVISRDNNNVVTVQVLAEKGRRGSRMQLPDGSDGFRYGKVGSVISTYKVQLPSS